MKRKVRKAVKYSELTKRMVIYDIVSEGISIASACMQNGIDEVYMVREWVREYMKKRDMLRIPRTLTKRKNAPMVLIHGPINRQFERYEEVIMYQESLIEALYSEADEETKKKLLEKLSSSRRKRLKRTGRL
jgi:transposase-like protein